jgi:hypothetical protein
MDPLNKIFDNLDAWRHLPTYQLERRADIFFSLYLKRAVEEKYGVTFRDELIPEFPVRIGTIDSKKTVNQSYRIDYLMVSESGDLGLLVELKTDPLSVRPDQIDYLFSAKQAGLAALVGGVLELFRATPAKRKNFRLLESLERLGLVKIPEILRDIMGRDSLRGASLASREVRVARTPGNCKIVFIQPTVEQWQRKESSEEKTDAISFEDFARVVEADETAFAQRFAQSLRAWASVPAGRAAQG